MKFKIDSPGSPEPGQISSLSVLCARLTWSFFGPAALFFAIVGNFVNGAGWLTGLDAFYGIVVGLVLLGRWMDHRSGSSTTLAGEPASDADFRKYLTVFPLVAISLWTVANILGNHVLNEM